MKTKLLITGFLALFLFVSTSSYAQENKTKKGKTERKEKLDSLKKKYFNNSLSLTEEEQKKFWPLYEEYQNKLKVLKKDFRKKYKKNDIIYMDDKGADQYLKDLNALKENELKIFKDYQTKFKAFLSPKKVVMIYRTEKEWQIKIKSFIREKYKKGKDKIKQKN